jgi:putative (di)nucleoside polyphosphate hydrolase
MNGIAEPEEVPEGYRPNVGVMLINAAGDVFVAQRLDMPSSAWQMPQGGIDPGEDAETAAFRELEEEIGTARAEILAATEGWLTYDLPSELRTRLWGGRFRGQAQKWFAMAFRGRDEDIDLETEHPEFSTWRWAHPEELPDLIVPFKRPLYERLLEEFDEVLERFR